MDLRQEVEYLSTQLKSLRTQHRLIQPHGEPAWELVAMTNRFKRSQAELENEMLRRALFKQSSFLKGMKTALIRPPRFLAVLESLSAKEA